MPVSPHHIPELYPNETVYSFCARYQRRLQLATTQVKRDLFGTSNASTQGILASGLTHLASVLSAHRSISAIELIERHTLFPYFSAFVKSENRKRAINAMKESGTAALLLGVRTLSLSPVPGRLRHCPVCFEEMLAKHGEAYWRRDHQLTAAVMCPLHGAMLINSSVFVRPDTKSADLAGYAGEYIAPTLEVLGALADPPVLPASSRLALLVKEIEELTQNVLSGGSLGLDPENLSSGYMRLIDDAGYLKAKQYDVLGLQEALTPFFWDLSAIWPGFLDIYGNIGPWLHAFLARRSKPSNPFLHTVLIAGLTRLPSARRGSKPFGDGPWPCLNPVVDHFGDLRIDSSERFSRSQKITWHRFTCDCGCIYLRGYRPDGTVSKPRIDRIGRVLIPLAQKAIQKNQSLQSISKELRISSDLFLRSLYHEGVEHPWSNYWYRNFLVAQGERDARANAPPKSRPPAKRQRGPRYDAAKLDALDSKWSTIVEEAARAIKAETPERRVTLNTVRRVSGVEMNLQRYPLPKTMLAFEKHLEDRDAFDRRRIINTLARSDGTLTASEIVRELYYSPNGEQREHIAKLCASLENENLFQSES
ncbi:MAG: TnsD family Tn7-like transposition protein [Methylovirgula sp.]